LNDPTLQEYPVISTFRNIGVAIDDSPLAQHIAIEQLLHQYAHAIDRPLSSPETVEDRIKQVFHPEATIEYEGPDYSEGSPTLFSGSGPDGWYRYFDNWRTMHQEKVRFNRHSTTTAVICLDGDNRAQGTSYLRGGAYPTSSEGEFRISHGVYRDEFVKEGGRWWIKYRHIHILYVVRVPPEYYRNLGD
jgi:hypothetical protein